LNAHSLLPHQPKARPLDEPLVHARWHEQEEAEGAPEAEFVVGHRARDDHGIREQGPTAGAKHPAPLPKHRRYAPQLRLHLVHAALELVEHRLRETVFDVQHTAVRHYSSVRVRGACVVEADHVAGFLDVHAEVTMICGRCSV